MQWLKSSLCLLGATLLVPIPLVTAPAQAQLSTNTKTWQISQTFKPPKRGAPTTTIGGASRGGACLKDNKELKALIPSNRLGLTIAQNPSFFVYVPESTIKTAQLTILSNGDKTVFYETTLTLPDQPGIISFNLPVNAPPLEVGKTYHWYFSLVCDPQDSSNNPREHGWIERVAPESTLSEALAKADLGKQSYLYAEAGIWHEALKTLVDLRRNQPNDLRVKMGWRQLLKSVGLNNLASEPIIDCCTANK
jgi:hypothetical protein